MSKTIEIDIHRGKLITFSIEIEGLEHTVITGMFRILIDDIEYGFPTAFHNNEVEVHIPCLHDLLHEINERVIYAKLEIVADHHYFVPWEGKLKLIEPASIKAKVKKSKATAEAKIKTEVKDQEVDEQQEIIIDDPEHTVDIPKLKTKKSKVAESTKNDYLEKLKKIDEDGIRDYMKRAGTKNENVQNVLLEQAGNICRDSDDKFELLKSVIKVMKTIKKGEKET